MRRHALCLFLASSLVTGCASRPENSGKASSQDVTGTRHAGCFGAEYAADKGAYDWKQEIPAGPVVAPDDKRADAPFQRVFVRDHPLGTPPEISRIQKGLVANFVGLFINDGMESWTAVDLDRMEVVSVARRIYDKRAALSRPFGDPVFPAYDRTTIVRKWSDGHRTEMEVVSRAPIQPAAAEAFVCVANAVWEQPKQPHQQVFISDAAPGSAEMSLFDRAQEGGRTYLYEKTEPRFGASRLCFLGASKPAEIRLADGQTRRRGKIE
jgi:hypothetical protein